MEHSEGICSTLPRTKMKGISVKYDTVLAKVEEGSCYIDDDHELNQKKLISHQHRSICLSDLVLLIHTVFQAVSFRSITKEELVHKIILNNCDIDDSIEVMMQIEQLEKLVPDWFYEKLAPCGDQLYKLAFLPFLQSYVGYKGGPVGSHQAFLVAVIFRWIYEIIIGIGKGLTSVKILLFT
ncbi:unnamed protein product [Fraxinus pennsylvanica]|uniref:DNA replication factor Cdt1 C-terminal domain-containing protein n=1 Tax=Fraxinus pennsylvanica TaxID=56036 RepID=A0AAD1ZPW8_9LAMI|nr:unnamed protein product [Fraxinus pennsylvanica]